MTTIVTRFKVTILPACEGKRQQKIVKIDCHEFTKCNEFKENGDKFLYNECIKKLPNKISDYETCLLSR